MTSEPKIYKLDQTISLFNQGRASFQRALNANQANNFSEAETALISAARDVADSLEWAFKIYLNNIPKLSGDDRRRLRQPNFHVLITLMKKYGKPPLTEEQGQQMYGYRDMRNEATHGGAIPPVKEVKKAIEGVRQFLHRYFNVGEQQLSGLPEAIEPEPMPPPPSLSSSQIRRLKREKQSLERQLEMLSNKIDALHNSLTLETRVEERMRLQAVIEIEEKLQAEFEEKLDDIERQLAGQGPESQRSEAVDYSRKETIPGDPEQKASGNSSGDKQPAGDIKADITGNISGQVAIGTGNVMIQTSSNVAPPAVTKADHVEFQNMLTNLKNQVSVVIPPEKRDASIERIEELEEAIGSQKPNLDTIGYVKSWFAKNAPVVVEAVNELIVHPTTGKIITAADQTLGVEFKRRFS